MSDYSPANVLYDGFGNPVVVIDHGSGTYRLGANVRSPGEFAVLTTSPLGAGEIFESNWIDVREFTDVDIVVQGTPVSVPGWLSFEFSEAGVTTRIGPVSVPVHDLTQAIPYPLRVTYPYFRVRYTNGNVPQASFFLGLMQHPTIAGDLTRSLGQVISPGEPVKIHRALIEPSMLGDLKILGADRAVFGDAITSTRIDQLSADFSLPLANNGVATSTVGTGSLNQGVGQATLQTGVVAGSLASMETLERIFYAPGHEMYAYFTARFTETGQAGDSYQRIGLFDANNGIFLGFEGTEFGVTRRFNGVDDFSPQSSFNGDLLDGSGFSRFSRGDLVEPIALSNLNVWRIKFGWLGGAVCLFDVLSPNGHWINFHTIRNPNSSPSPLVADPNLIFQASVGNGAGVSSLVLGTSSWAAGVVNDPFGLSPEEVKSRTDVEIVQTGLVSSSASAYTVPQGRRFRMTDIVLSLTSDSASAERFILRDGVAGALKLPIEIPPLAGSARATINLSHTYSVPLNFDTEVWAAVPNLGNGFASFSIRGYLDRMPM